MNFMSILFEREDERGFVGLVLLLRYINMYVDKYIFWRMFCQRGFQSHGMYNSFFPQCCGESACGRASAAAPHLPVFACSSGGLSREKEDRQQARERITINDFRRVKLVTACSRCRGSADNTSEHKTAV